MSKGTVYVVDVSPGTVSVRRAIPLVGDLNDDQTDVSRVWAIVVLNRDRRCECSIRPLINEGDTDTLPSSSTNFSGAGVGVGVSGVGADNRGRSAATHPVRPVAAIPNNRRTYRRRIDGRVPVVRKNLMLWVPVSRVSRQALVVRSGSAAIAGATVLRSGVTYDELGVSPDASATVVETAARQRFGKTHLDQDSDREEYLHVKQVREELGV